MNSPPFLFLVVVQLCFFVHCADVLIQTNANRIHPDKIIPFNIQMFQCFNVQMFKCSKVSTQLHPRSCTSLGCNSDIMDCMISTNCSLAVFCFTLSSVSASQWQKKHILDVVKTILVLHNYNTAKSKSTVLAFFSMVFISSLYVPVYCSVPLYQCNPPCRKIPW